MTQAPVKQTSSSSQRVFGVPATASGRAHLLYSQNKNASCVSLTFLRKLTREEKNLGIQPTTDNLICFDAKNVTSYAKSLAPDIAHHAEMRLQLFMQQLFLVYTLGLEFFKSNTELQTGTGTKELHAAHSSILTSFTYRQQGDKTPSSTVFAKGSEFYYDWNSTDLLPTMINLEIDLQIEEKIGFPVYDTKTGIHYNFSNFREFSLFILSAVSSSSGSICSTPRDGLVAFLKLFINVLGFIDIKNDDNKKFVVATYAEVASSYLKQLDASDDLFAKFFDVPLKGKAKYFEASFYTEMHSRLYLKLAQAIAVPVQLHKYNLELQRTTALPLAFYTMKPQVNTIVVTEKQKELATKLSKNAEITELATKYLKGSTTLEKDLQAFATCSAISKIMKEKDLSSQLQVLLAKISKSELIKGAHGANHILRYFLRELGESLKLQDSIPSYITSTDERFVCTSTTEIGYLEQLLHSPNVFAESALYFNNDPDLKKDLNALTEGTKTRMYSASKRFSSLHAACLSELGLKTAPNEFKTIFRQFLQITGTYHAQAAATPEEEKKDVKPSTAQGSLKAP